MKPTGRRGFLKTIAMGLAAGMPRMIVGQANASGRTRRLLDVDWRFTKGDPPGSTLNLVKSWTLPTGNDFLKDPGKRHSQPAGNPGDSVSYIYAEFDDSTWRKVNVPHDYAIEGPFITTGGG